MIPLLHFDFDWRYMNSLSSIVIASYFPNFPFYAAVASDPRVASDVVH